MLITNSGGGPVFDQDFLGGSLGTGALTRPSTGTYFNSSGVMVSAASNVPRFDYDPATLLPKGLLLEDQSTNLSLDYTNYGAGDATQTPTSGTAPDGTNSMVRLAETAASAVHYNTTGFTFPSSAMIAFSVYAKAAGVRYLQLYMDDNISSGGQATFDLQTGTISEALAARGGGVLGGAFIQQISNGIWRLNVNIQMAASTSGRAGLVLCNSATPGFAPGYAGNPANGVLFWGLKLEVGCMTSYIFTTNAAVTRAADVMSYPIANVTGFDTTRGTLAHEYILEGVAAFGFSSSAAFVGATPTTDYIIPEQYDASGTRMTPSVNAAAASVGAAIAYCLMPPTSAGAGPAHRAAASWAVNNVVHQGYDGIGDTSSVNSVSALPVVTNLILAGSAHGQPIVSHWARRTRYWGSRLSQAQLITETTVNGPSLSLDFMTLGSLDARIAFTRASTGTYFDAGGTMRTAAANAPRWDYDPRTHALRGVLIEESRTNLVGPSVPGPGQFPNETTMVPNAGAAPDGTNSFVKMNNTTTNSFHGYQTIGTGAPNTTYTCSAYVKKGEIRYLQFIFDDLGGGQPASICTFDLQTGTISSGGGSSSITNVGNGIYRCVMAPCLSGASTTQIRLGLNNCNIPNPGFYSPGYVGAVTDGTYLWGLQVEPGSFATSHIFTPAAGAAVTRAQDSCLISSANMVPWFTTTGSWLAEFIFTNPAPSGNRIVGAATSVGGDIGPLMSSTSPFQLGFYDGASFFPTVNNIVSNVVQRGANTSTGPGTAKLCLNGGPIASLVATNGLAAMASSGVRFLNTVTGASPDNGSGYIRRVSFWPRALSDAEMQAVTT